MSTIAQMSTICAAFQNSTVAVAICWSLDGAVVMTRRRTPRCLSLSDAEFWLTSCRTCLAGKFFGCDAMSAQKDCTWCAASELRHRRQRLLRGRQYIVFVQDHFRSRALINGLLKLVQSRRWTSSYALALHIARTSDLKAYAVFKRTWLSTYFLFPGKLGTFKPKPTIDFTEKKKAGSNSSLRRVVSGRRVMLPGGPVLLAALKLYIEAQRGVGALDLDDLAYMSFQMTHLRLLRLLRRWLFQHEAALLLLY